MMSYNGLVGHTIYKTRGFWRSKKKNKNKQIILARVTFHVRASDALSNPF